MSRGLNLLCPDYTKERNNENEAIVFGYGATVQLKKMVLGAHSGDFLQTPAHSTLQCANIRPFCLPRSSFLVVLFICTGSSKGEGGETG